MNAVQFDPTQARRFIDLAYPAAVTGLLHVCCKDDWNGRQFHRSDINGLTNYVGQLDQAGTQGIYLRAMTVRPGVSGRGKVEDSVELIGLWSDIDIEGPGHKHDPSKFGGLVLPPDVPEAVQLVGVAGLPVPTLWIHSGGGIYAWWLTERPILAAEVGLSTLEDLSKRWQAVLAAGAKSRGYHYGTGVFDLARVLRLPGTVNRKVPTDPRQCHIAADSGPRYSLDGLRSVLMGAEKALGMCVSQQLTALGPRTAAEELFNGGRSWVPVAPHTGSPFDDFETRTDWRDILCPVGWTEVARAADGSRQWVRPGKKPTEGISATTGRDLGRDRMWNFSTEAGLPVNEPMTKGYVYAVLNHGGDQKAAAAYLAAYGYGAQPTVTAPGGNNGGPVSNPARRVVLTVASSIKPKRVRWLWDGRIPLGELSLLGGREGIGKSTVGYQLTADITQGKIPGEYFGQPKPVVVIATEDSWAHTIVPRIRAAGANLDMVYRADVITAENVETGLVLPGDLTSLKATIERLGAVWVFLDPLMSRLDSKLDTHKDAEVRQALEPLVQLAHDCHVAMMGIIHVNKSGSTDALTSLMGSRAFAAVARAVLYVMVDPEDETERRRLLVQAKNNLGRSDLPALAFEIEPRIAAYDDDGAAIHTGAVKWLGEVQRGLSSLLEASYRSPEDRTAISAATDWLRDYLAACPGGQFESSEIKRAGEMAGHTRSTLDRARKRVPVESVAEEGSFPRRTLWKLPAAAQASSPPRLGQLPTVPAPPTAPSVVVPGP